VRHSQQDAAAARVLAGGADRDVTEVRQEIRDFRDQNTRVLNAMREDLADLRSQMHDGFAEIDGKFAQVNDNFARIDGRFGEVNGNFAQVNGNFAQVNGNFAQVNGNFGQVSDKFSEVDNGFAGIRARLDAAAAGQEKIARMLSILIAREGGPGGGQ
jgi:ABC-type transporter Mla subunit MlaD